MSAYGILLKKLIHFTNIKLTNLAEAVGYDTSYISKWCNKNKLPAAKSASSVNQRMAEIFAKEIFYQNETAVFAMEFNLGIAPDEQQLASDIYQLLKDAYKKTHANITDNMQNLPLASHRLLLWQPEILSFLKTDLPQTICQMQEGCEILCTMDICGFLSWMNFESGSRQFPDVSIHVKTGLNPSSISQYPDSLHKLYYLINHYHYVDFDFFDNTHMDKINLLIIKNCMALQCSLDDSYHFNMISVITDIGQVNAVYEKIETEFNVNRLLIQHAESDALFYNDYRTEFYAHDSFQILLTRGFEFLLPPEINPKLIQAARTQGFGEDAGKFILHLGITWEEIFEKGSIDFYLLKTRIMQYVSDGDICFADITYHMSIKERKSHVQHILELIQSNPNIRFHIIEDESIPNADDLFQWSVYNNKKKLFLKNVTRRGSKHDPSFYTIQNEQLINAITDCFEKLAGSNHCTLYETADVLRVYEKYGKLIDRMISATE